VAKNHNHSNMKTNSTLILFLLLTISLTAQKLPSLGKIDKEDILYKECSYDKDAPAEYLIDYGEVRYFFTSSDFVNEGYYRVRIKIFNEKGLEYANVRLPYYTKSNRQSVGRIEGYTFNVDDAGNVITDKLGKDAILKQKIDEDHDMMVFTMPNAKVGSVIEYRYYRSKRNYYEIDDWNFQNKIPVRHSEYVVEIPSIFQFTYQKRISIPLEETTEGIAKAKRFVMKNIPGLDKEPYMSCSKDYLQRVDFQLSAVNQTPVLQSWKQLCEELLQREDFGIQLKKNVYKNLDDLKAEVAKCPTKFEQVNTIYKYVKRNVTWNGNNSFLTETGVKNSLEKHSGNSADMNILLVNLLRDAGFESYPLLVSTRDNGKVNMLYPFIYQFNNVYAYVDVEGKGYVLDASNRHNPSFMVPWDVQFTQCYLVDNKIHQLVSLEDMKHGFKLNTSVTATIDDKGTVSGSANVLNYHYSKNQRLTSIGKGKDKYQAEYFESAHPDYKFESLVIKNEEKDSLPLENNIKFKGQLNTSGEYVFYSPNFLLELETNDFIADQRFSDIEFGYTQYYNLYASVQFPANMEVEELPKNFKMIMPDTSIVLQRFMQKNENTISMRMTLEIKRPTYYADEYDYFKEFYAKLFEILNEQIVFRKKANPKP
jgi:transglutaminase-like putative cysteine protease